MTVWYRASTIANIKNVFSGEGGLFTAARWNHLGRKVIYCSQSISLCTLEWLSHHGLSVSGFNYYRYSLEVPDALVYSVALNELPKEWDTTPATDVTRDFADQYLFSTNQYIALALPSVLVPEERNLILNPLHEDFHKIIKTAKTLGLHSAPVR